MAVKFRSLLWILGVGLLIGMAPFSLYADSGKNKLTPKIISETFRTYDQCHYSSQSKLYNCDCVAEQFIKLRTKNPTGDDVQVFIDLAKTKCVDTAPIAGEIYQSCLSDKMLSGTKKQREYFCSCVGREAGYEYARNRNLQQNAQIVTMEKVYKICDLTRMFDFND